MLSVGDVVPDFELLNQDGERVRLSDYRGQRLVIFTFAKAGTLGCTRQACTLRDAFPQIDAANTAVLAISQDRPEELTTWKTRERLPYDLLSDPDGEALKMFGGAGFSVLSVRLPVRLHTLWVLDEQGVVRQAHVPVLLGEVAGLALKALEALPESA